MALPVSSLLFRRGGWIRNRRASSSELEPDGLDAFAAERDAVGPARTAHASGGRWHRWTIGALTVVALVEAPIAGLWLYEESQHSTDIAALPRTPGIPAVAPLVPVVPPPIDLVVPEYRSVARNSAPARAAIREPQGESPSLMVGGWVSMKTPVPMQVFEEGRLVGTTEVDRIMLPVGDHRLEIVSEALGYRSRQEVAIWSGQTSTLRLEMPTGKLAVNALPWAEVWIDGEPLGQTPIGNLTRTIGPHEIVFRHPDLGEKKTTVIVTLKEPARVGVDLRSTP